MQSKAPLVSMIQRGFLLPSPTPPEGGCVREHVDEEGHVYRVDRAGRVLTVNTDHTMELADALAMLARELPRTREELHAWKWAVIAAHNAVQNIVADCAAGDRSRQRREIRTLGNRLWESHGPARRRAFEAFFGKMWQMIRRGEELQELRDFLDLFDRVNEKWRLPVPDGLRDRMVALNDERNAWIHFGAGSYEFEVHAYPSLLLECLGWVEYLGWKTSLVFWSGDKVKDRARASLGACLATLRELVAEYS